jgi:large subunit ribosomal protein L31e
MANLERIYTIPLKAAYEHPRNKRGKRAVRLIQAFALRHMKAESVRVSEGVNSNILRDGIEKPPRRIKVRMVKGDDALVRVWLIGEEEKIKALADKKKKESEDKKKTEEAAKKAADAKKEEAKKAADAKKAAEAKPASTAAAAGAQSPKATQATPASAAKPK